MLPDTSVWVDFLRSGGAGDAAGLDQLLQDGEVCVCGPVVAELMAGVVKERQLELWQLLAGLEWCHLGPPQWRRVGEVASALRRAGRSAALTDVEIAVAAADHGAWVWTRDSDFDRIASVLPELRRFAP